MTNEAPPAGEKPVADVDTDAVTDLETVVEIDEEAVLARFKEKYCVEGSIVLDAWVKEGFIQYYIAPDSLMSILNSQIPGEFEGLPTLVTVFPRHSDVGVVFNAAQCDLVIAALNYAFINIDKFKAHLTEQGHPDTAKAADGLEGLRIMVTERQHEAQKDDV